MGDTVARRRRYGAGPQIVWAY
ncbi:MAG: hypothetical protein QOC85_3399, partial [Streptomyces sp.]|nr:hypothetical protein [Streptomyces sp.]